MQYALLIYGPEATERPTEEEIGTEIAAYDAFWQHVSGLGAMRGGEALHPSSTATTVRVRDGQTLTTDGPFAETKEVLGGFYVVEAADLDEAIAYAALIPGAKDGSVEIRPIIDFSAIPSANGADAVAAG
ncbi:MAG: YciI family protein [Candidatus Limnocylindrales bacterium]